MFDREGKGFSIGGLQRWCRDLAMLGQKKGYQIKVYQKAIRPFKKDITEGFSVRGLVCAQSFRGNWKFCRELLKHVDPKEPFVFASQELALSNRFQRAVAINHGIAWNGDIASWKKWINRRLQHRLLYKMRGIICVDTNYINWCHAEFPNRKFWQSKLVYIPNYADLDTFKPIKNRSYCNRPLTLLFPRRIHDKGRGANFFLEAWEVLERRGCKARALFVGSIIGAEIQKKDLWDWAAARGMQDRLEVSDAEMDDMPSVYAKADVVVIPSVAQEGTSLSAIEGIVSGKPTVVSHIGGLGNIVINGLNGHICDLSPESLADAILQSAETRLLENNPEVLARCRESLGKTRWEHQVWRFLVQYLEL